MAATDICMGEKVLWGKILGLIGVKGFCFAGNAWLAKQLGFSKATVSTYICHLVERGYLKRQIIRAKDGEGKIVERRLFPVSDHSPIGIGLWSDRGIGPESEGSGDSKSVDKEELLSADKPRFPAEWYRQSEKDYQVIKGVTLTGPEFGPLQRDLKLIYQAGHEPDVVRQLMLAFEDSAEKWTDGWTIGTVRMKLAEFVAGKLVLSGNGKKPMGTNRGAGYYLAKRKEAR